MSWHFTTLGLSTSQRISISVQSWQGMVGVETELAIIFLMGLSMFLLLLLPAVPGGGWTRTNHIFLMGLSMFLLLPGVPDGGWTGLIAYPLGYPIPKLALSLSLSLSLSLFFFIYFCLIYANVILTGAIISIALIVALLPLEED